MRDRRLKEVLGYLKREADAVKSSSPEKAKGIEFSIKAIKEADTEAKDNRQKKRLKRSNQVMQSTGPLA